MNTFYNMSTYFGKENNDGKIPCEDDRVHIHKAHDLRVMF